MKRDDFNASYTRLIPRFPLKTIASDAEYRRVAAVVDSLAVKGEADINPGEREYLDSLARSLDAYDDGRMKFLVK